MEWLETRESLKSSGIVKQAAAESLRGGGANGGG